MEREIPEINRYYLENLLQYDNVDISTFSNGKVLRILGTSGFTFNEKFYGIPEPLIAIDLNENILSIYPTRFLDSWISHHDVIILVHSFINKIDYDELILFPDNVQFRIVYRDRRAWSFLSDNYPLIVNVIRVLLGKYHDVEILGNNCCQTLKEIIYGLISSGQEVSIGGRLYDPEDPRTLIKTAIRLYDQSLIYYPMGIINWQYRIEALTRLIYLYHVSFIGEDEYSQWLRDLIIEYDKKNVRRPDGLPSLIISEPAKWIGMVADDVDYDKQVLKVRDVEVKISRLLLSLIRKIRNDIGGEGGEGER